MQVRSKQFLVGVLGTALGVMLGKLLYDVAALVYSLSGGIQ
jgi:hypothetical protein